ncbi:MAG: iron-sulfur cluster assembly scaffold protein [Hyphomicrobium sp.]|nr:iron-sulfur cluster assembly scaffold protein [Hyphomicrobium sp.]
MADLDEIYNTRILELAGAMTHGERLADPDATATAHSKLCGSTITVDIIAENGRVTDYGQTVKACLLGQAAASVMAQHIVGSSFAELRQVAADMRAMLKNDAAAPGGRFADLAVLAPVRAYKARHASTLLVFDAVERALDDVEAKSAVKVAASVL